MLFTLKRTRDQKNVGNVHFIINYDSFILGPLPHTCIMMPPDVDIIRLSTMNIFSQNYKLNINVFYFGLFHITALFIKTFDYRSKKLNTISGNI